MPGWWASHTARENLSQRVKPRWRIDLGAAVYAGIAAGVSATLFQILLWWIVGDDVPRHFDRDARLAAAIVLGRGALQASASDWIVLGSAGGVHFALSISYAVMLAGFVARRAMLPSLLAGGLFGLTLYAINMYGFTIVFPWFADTRDPITVAAHAAFGISAAACYRTFTRARKGSESDRDIQRRQ